MDSLADDVLGQCGSAAFIERFAAKARDEWTANFAGFDVCITAALSWVDVVVAEHPLACDY